MRCYMIQRTDTNEFYKHRPYGNRWVKDIFKAKRYSRLGDVGNAITLMREQKSVFKKMKFKVFEYGLEPTGNVYDR